MASKSRSSDPKEILECIVCGDTNSTSVKRKFIRCPRCFGTCCVECCKSWLLNSEIPKCFGGTLPDEKKCDQDWDTEFLQTNFSSSFLSGDFKIRQLQICLQRELSQLPETGSSPEFEIAKFYHDTVSDSFFNPSLQGNFRISYSEKHAFVNEMDNRCPGWQNTCPRPFFYKISEIFELDRIFRDSFNEERVSKRKGKAKAVYEPEKIEDIELKQDLLDLINDLVLLIETFQERKSRVFPAGVGISLPAVTSDGLKRDKYGNIIVDGEKNEEKDDVQKGRPCPQTDCRGFLSRNKCSLCEAKVCGDCWEIVTTSEMTKEEKSKKHKCNPDTVESVKMLKEDTKPCPACSTRIFKIYGCSQMYCTHCKTPFDWNTGKKLEMGRWFHNPHLDEEIGHGFNAGGECGQIESRIENILAGFNSVESNVYKSYHLYGHAQQIIENHRRFMQRRNNLDLRILYLLGCVERSKLAQEAYYRWRLFRRLQDEMSLFEAFRSRMAEFFNLLAKCKSINLGEFQGHYLWGKERDMIIRNATNFYTEKEEFLQILHDLQEALKKISQKYSLTAYRIGNDFSFSDKAPNCSVLSGIKTLDEYLVSLF